MREPWGVSKIYAIDDPTSSPSFTNPVGAATMVVIVGTMSFVAAELFRTSHPGAVFYLVPFRMFELCAGAILAIGPRRQQRRRITDHGDVW